MQTLERTMFRQSLDIGTNPAVQNDLIGAVAALINDHFDGSNGLVARLDRWTRQCIAVENQAKLAQILKSSDPVEACIASLIREIDREAEFGVYLASPAGHAAQLNRLSGQHDMSGRLFQHLDILGPIMFQRELALQPEQPELVWSTVEARYERACLDTEVSELILLCLLEDEEHAADRVDSLRANFYAYHEDRVRRRCRLPNLLDAHTTRALHTAITELRERAVLTITASEPADADQSPRRAC